MINRSGRYSRNIMPLETESLKQVATACIAYENRKSI